MCGTRFCGYLHVSSISVRVSYQCSVSFLYFIELQLDHSSLVVSKFNCTALKNIPSTGFFSNYCTPSLLELFHFHFVFQGFLYSTMMLTHQLNVLAHDLSNQCHMGKGKEEEILTTLNGRNRPLSFETTTGSKSKTQIKLGVTFPSARTLNSVIY